MFKVVFVLFFQGDALRTRVRKICEGSVGLYYRLCVYLRLQCIFNNEYS